MKFTLKKIDKVDNPITESSEDKTLQAQDLGGLSPWVGYTVKGQGKELPEIGRPFSMVRTNRNGIDVLGLYQTSKVREVGYVDNKFEENYYQFSTMNSLYRLYIEEYETD